MSELLETPPNSALGRAAYALVAVLICFELGVLWLALHPNVDANYRAYYIDQTSTCLSQPMKGTYTVGETLSFRSDGLEKMREVRDCGWEGPVGNGLHSIGETSRLRFAVPADATGLTLILEMQAVETEFKADQVVRVSANGVPLGELNLGDGEIGTFSAPIPDEVVASTGGMIAVALDYPTALRMLPRDSNTRKRAIKLLSGRVGPD